MDSGVIAAWVGIGITVIGGAWAIIKERINNATKFALMEQTITTLQREYDEHREHNKSQHEELYQSRNDMRDVLTRLTALFESMDKKQDAMDRKLDTLLERRGNNRE